MITDLRLPLRRPIRSLKPRGGHPLMPRLAFIFAESGGLQTVGLGEPGIVGTLQTGAIFARRGIDITGSGFVDIPYASDTPFTGALTIVWKGIIDSGANFQHFAGKHAGGGGTACPFDYRTDTNATRQVLVRAHATDHRGWQSDTTLVGSGYQTLGMVAPSAIETAPTFYFNGVSSTASAVSGGAIGSTTGSGANIRIGRRDDGAVQLDGTAEFVLFYDRELTAGAMAWLHRDPYVWLGSRSVLFDATAPAAAPARVPSATVRLWR